MLIVLDIATPATLVALKDFDAQMFSRVP